MFTPDLTFHGYFGRFAGDASEPHDFHSDEWTQVRHKTCMNKGKEISKSRSNWKTIQNARGRANLEVDPKEEYKFVYLNNGNDSKMFKEMLETNLIKKMHTKKFLNHVSKLSIGKIKKHLREIMKNDSILEQE